MRWLLLLLPMLLGFDGEQARQALDRAFHNLYGSDLLAGVELEIEGPRDSSWVQFAFGRRSRGDETRTLVYMPEGGRAAPRALLLQRAGENDRIWVSEGAHGSVRMLSAGRSAWPLFGSDFSYDDFRSHGADDFGLEVLGPDMIEEEPCRVLRLRPFDGPYAAIVVWISEVRPVILRADYFDGGGLWKRYTADVERVARHYEWWVPMEDEMFDVRTGSRTIRRIRNLLIDLEVPEDLFTTTRLSRGRLPKF
jgi:hypothetical protein